MEITAQISEVLEAPPSLFVSEHQPMVLEISLPEDQFEVEEPAEEIEIVVRELPGAPLQEERDQEREQKLEVRDDTVESNQTMEAKDKKLDLWDVAGLLAKDGPEAVYHWAKDTLDSTPMHSGFDKAGLLRAAGYVKKMVDALVKAMESDLDGKLDANKMEDLLAKLEEAVDRIHERIEKVSRTSKKKRRKKSEFEITGIVKEAQKSPSVHDIVVMVPLFIHRLARVCINGMVSGGHDLMDTYAQLCDKWDLTEREKAELQQLLGDMGYTIGVWNRGIIPDKEDFNKQHGEFDLASSYIG
jgi:hypothetical protein